jgi:hypothetical protein
VFIVNDIVVPTETEARYRRRGIGADNEHDTVMDAGVWVAVFDVDNVRGRNSAEGDRVVVDGLVCIRI